MNTNYNLIRKKMEKLTQVELSQKLGAGKNLISNYENGYSTPDLFALWQLADIFEVSLDELVGRDFY